jgi:hypothetical protein
VDPQGAKALVLRSGDPAPGAGPDELLGSLGNAVLNDRGQIATTGTILLPPEEWWYDEQAVFGPDGPNLALRAREGDPAPGLPGKTYHEFERIDLNIHGEMVFWAKVEPTVLGTPRKGGLFFVDRAGVVQPILGPGQTVTVAEGDVRLVDFVPSLDPIGKSEARTIFTDSGAIVFPVEFTDGTGALILAQVRRVHACGAGPELALLLLVARRARKLR